MPDFLVFSAIVPRLFGARLILDLHDPMPELSQVIFKLPPKHMLVSLLKRVEQWSIRFAHLALTPNIAFKRLFESRGCPPERMQIIMNSPEADIFRDGVEPWADSTAFGGTGTFRVLHHGSIVHRHGLDLAVDAVALAREHIPHIHLTICGSRTAFLDEVLNEARAKGIEKCVTFVGSKPHSDIARLIAAADVGIIPNRRSPFTELNMPTRIFEYLAMGKPVIAPATLGIRDYFDDSNLIFFEPGSSADLAAQLLWLYRNGSEARARVDRGREIYRQHVWEAERERLVQMAADLVTTRE
jgi:glycosyltransferase involved in cell wall biosynthesis